MSMVFYLASVVLSLYAAYLFTFKTYNTDCEGHPKGRMACLNIIYLLVWLFAFVPILNAVMTVALAVGALVNMSCNDVYVDSWLFRKPKEKDDKEG